MFLSVIYINFRLQKSEIGILRRHATVKQEKTSLEAQTRAAYVKDSEICGLRDKQ
jgi:hypothetical protein